MALGMAMSVESFHSINFPSEWGVLLLKPISGKQSRHRLRSSGKITQNRNTTPKRKTSKPLPSKAARLPTRKCHPIPITKSLAKSNNHRPRKLTNRRPNSPSFHLTTSMLRQRIKTHTILIQLHPFFQTPAQLLKLLLRQNTLKTTILHPLPIPLQQIKNRTPAFITRNIINHHIKKHDSSNLIRLIQPARLINKLLKKLNLLIQ